MQSETFLDGKCAKSSSRHIIILSPASTVGGAENYLCFFAKHLLSLGHKVSVGLDKVETLNELALNLQNSGVSVYRTNLMWSWDASPITVKLKKQFYAVWSLLQTVAPDTVFINLNWVDAGTAISTAAAIANIPTMVLFHLCPHVVPMTSEQKKLLCFSRYSSQKWFTVSRDNRFFVARSVGIDESNLGVIYNGPLIDFSSYHNDANLHFQNRAQLRHELGLDTNTLIIATVGRHDIQKGFLDIFPLLPNLFSLHQNLHYLWIGNGPLRKLSERLVNNNPNTKSRMTFWPHRSDILQCLAGSDIFLFPTRFEGFSLALLEAMHVGCCPVVSDVSSVREIIEDGITGCIVRQGDICNLLSTLNDLLVDDYKRLSIGEEASKSVARFSSSSMMNNASREILSFDKQCKQLSYTFDEAWGKLVDIITC